MNFECIKYKLSNMPYMYLIPFAENKKSVKLCYYGKNKNIPYWRIGNSVRKSIVIYKSNFKDEFSTSKSFGDILLAEIKKALASKELQQWIARGRKIMKLPPIKNKCSICDNILPNY